MNGFFQMLSPAKHLGEANLSAPRQPAPAPSKTDELTKTVRQMLCSSGRQPSNIARDSGIDRTTIERFRDDPEFKPTVEVMAALVPQLDGALMVDVNALRVVPSRSWAVMDAAETEAIERRRLANLRASIIGLNADAARVLTDAEREATALEAAGPSNYRTGPDAQTVRTLARSKARQLRERAGDLYLEAEALEAKLNPKGGN